MYYLTCSANFKTFRFIVPNHAILYINMQYNTWTMWLVFLIHAEIVHGNLIGQAFKCNSEPSRGFKNFGIPSRSSVFYWDQKSGPGCADRKSLNSSWKLSGHVSLLWVKWSIQCFRYLMQCIIKYFRCNIAHWTSC